MTYGLRVKNATGELQIDENWLTYCLESSGTTTSTNTLQTVSVTGTANYPIVFCRPNLTWNEINTKGGAALGVRWISNSGKDFYTINDFSDYIDWQAYETSDTFSVGTGYGLAIWDSSGDLAFTSNEYGPRIIGSVSAALGYGGGTAIWTGTTSDPVPYGFMNPHGHWKHIQSDPPPDPPTGEDEFSGYLWDVSGTTAYVYRASVTQTHDRSDSTSFDSKERLQLVINGG